ncbi:Endoribonuclease Dicer [Nosema bombycis CQ1]|uniref:Endoribonuclease Dicer n=1 Tax=Nosema bombycis (strain CQ1 / CVCC 102059) TaxID=578461 RepID=R0KX00_NOSB1|nr:Endoribonuclease Dicer [Nosema bombycis CQ1]|eukprot:EOB15391.1 Endoribonuclease Dicer [Nosema bombycis CQ1]
MLDHAKSLLKKKEHKIIIERYLKEGNVVVHGQSVGFEDNPKVFILLKNKKDKIKDMANLSTLLIMDELQCISNCPDCEFNENFVKSVKNNSEINLVDINLSHSPNSKTVDSTRICLIHEILSFKFKNIVYFKYSNDFPVDFLRNVISNSKKDLKGFVKYCTKSREEYLTNPKGSIIALDFSVLFFEHVLYLINKCFEKHFLFFKSPKATRTFENSEDEKFVCIFELPKFADDEIFNSKIRSDKHVLKKDACKEASYKALITLHKAGYLDHRLCPVPEKFIHKNGLYFERIRSKYGIESRDFEEIRVKIDEMLLGIKEDYNLALEKFKKSNFIDLKETKATVSVDEILRKQPECMKNFKDIFCIYQFNEGSIGIACSDGFKESVNFKSIKITYLGTKKFTEEEIELILFYQIVFFSINFRRVLSIQSTSREYCYFALPLRNKEIDFMRIKTLYPKFLRGSVFETKDENILIDHLLFNPVLRTFYNYIGPSSIKFSDPVPSSLLSRMFKGKSNIKESHNEPKNHDQKNIDDYLINNIKKYNSEIFEDKYDLGISIKKKASVNNYTYLQYFEKIYGAKLRNKKDERNSIIEVQTYCSKEKIKSLEVHSGEVFFVTGVKNSTKKEYQDFLQYFNIFEHCAVAFEFIKDKNLNITLGSIATALSQREINSENQVSDLGYERLEFIGDSVLKFSISKFLFKERGYDLCKIVSTKDNLICNNYLYEVSKEMNLKKYISLIKFSENTFQPPAIKKFNEVDLNSKLDKYIEIFKGMGAFKNNNQEYFAFKYSLKQASESKTVANKKVFADIIEALIGAHYVEHGFDEAWNYIKKIGIPGLISQEKKESPEKRAVFKEEIVNVLDFLGLSSNNTSKVDLSGKVDFNNQYDEIYSYDEVLPRTRIEQIQNLIGYKFKNVGLLEKAVIHPSFENNIFGSERFQKLELIGDCFLDLKVSDYIYKNYTEASPFDLHTLRKSLVNNFTFATILFKSGLNDLVETGLRGEYSNFTHHKVSKVYSDLFEAIAGAVVLDSDFCLIKTNDFFLKMLKMMKENSRDC